MSGGIDSSTVAHLLKNNGHEVIGAMMQLWEDPLEDCTNIGKTKCCTPEHFEKAKIVCKSIGAPFHILDMEEEFLEEVIKPFLESYKKGKTPNPCITCNKLIKFGAFLKQAKALGCDAIATGHYARIFKDDLNVYHLLKAKDESKDQSYFLYNLTQEILKYVIFPLGDLQKKEVLNIAKELNIPIPETYKESQDICFYSENEPTEFLKRYLKNVPEGNICTEDGEIVGKHMGLPYYTIGQRKRLGVGGLKIPLHVKRKDANTNTLYTAPTGADFESELYVDQLNWIVGVPDNKSKLFASINSKGNTKECNMEIFSSLPKVTFKSPIRGIADDQSIVFYKDKEVLGGGIIVRPESII